MQGSEFLYFLTDNNNQFYSIANGRLKLSATPIPLEFSPDGWQEVSIQNQRNKKYFGIDRSVTIPYTFVEDGAAILKQIFYKYGVNAQVNLIICQQQLYYSGGEYGFWYKLLSKLDVDFSTFNHSGYKVTCNLLEGGFPKYLKANENTTYEFPLDDLAVNVKMDGIRLHGKINNEVLQKVYTLNPAGGLDQFYLATFFTFTEGEQIGLVTNNIFGDVVFGIDWTSDNWILKAVKGSTVRFTGKVRFLYRGSGFHFQLLLSTVLNGASSPNQGLYLFDGDLVDNVTYEVDINETVTLVDGESAFFTGYFTDGSLFEQITIDQSNINIETVTRQETTYIKALRPLDLFARLIDKVSEGAIEVDSTLLDLEKDKVWTCGNGIRGLSDSFIKISLSDFFAFWDTYKDVGMTVKNGKVILERKVDLINNSDIKALGQISSLKVTPATDLMFNTLKIGYPDKQQEGTNGKEAFNNTFEWSLGATRVVKSLDKTCKIVTDCYSVELTRVTFDGKDTTDSRQDNDTYVLHIESTTRPADGDIPEHFRLERSLNTGTTGLLEPDTVFNLALTPKRCMLNNGGYFRSVLDLMDTSILKFTTSSKNNAVVCDDLIEKEDIPVGLIGTRYFKPYYFDFDLIADNDLLDLLDENPLKVFSFEDVNGVVYKGIAEKVGIEPNYNKNQTYKLLCTSDTDLNHLNDYYGG